MMATHCASTYSPPPTTNKSAVSWKSAADTISEVHAEAAVGFSFDAIGETAKLDDAGSLPRGGYLPKRALGGSPTTGKVAAAQANLPFHTMI